MNERGLKQAIAEIRMPEEMRKRILRKCRCANATARRSMPRTVLIAATLMLSAAVVLAAGTGGMFEDVKNWQGAVVGTRYVQASDEIFVQAEPAVTDGESWKMKVNVGFALPEEFPYRAIEALDIGTISVLDAQERTVACTVVEQAESAAISDGKAQFELRLEGTPLTSGSSYVLQIESFYGLSKADQPLEITGKWRAEFSVE